MLVFLSPYQVECKKAQPKEVMMINNLQNLQAVAAAGRGDNATCTTPTFFTFVVASLCCSLKHEPMHREATALARVAFYLFVWILSQIVFFCGEEVGRGVILRLRYFFFMYKY